MTIINDQDIDFNNEKKVEETVFENQNSEESQNSDEKEAFDKEESFETSEAKLARLKRQYEREAKKQGLNIESEKPVKSSKANELDYGEKGFLHSNGIRGNEEMNLVRQLRKETGKSLEDLLESRFFKAELEDLRQIQNTINAIPSNSKRTNQSSVDSVDYWITKKELPKDTDLRRKVVNERIRRESQRDVFGN